jgi:hypothetical protein
LWVVGLPSDRVWGIKSMTSDLDSSVILSQCN